MHTVTVQSFGALGTAGINRAEFLSCSCGRGGSAGRAVLSQSAPGRRPGRMQKFYWSGGGRPQPGYPALKLAVNTASGEEEVVAGRTQQCLQVRTTDPPGSRPHSKKVVLQLGQPAGKPDLWPYSRTWTESTVTQLATGQNPARHRPALFPPDYENVYTAREMSSPREAAVRNTPRSRKRKKAAAPVARSRSCERVAGVLDKLSEKLSISSDFSSASPSLLQAVASRAIPCVASQSDTHCPQPGRGSPTGSHEPYDVSSPAEMSGSGSGILRPAAGLAGRMRGRLDAVSRKLRMVRSRSAERLRGCVMPEVIAVGERKPRPAAGRVTGPEWSGPVLGLARARVSCVPSPYDTDALAFSAGEIIEVLQMSPSGWWRGRCAARVGQFKFINVEMLRSRRRRSRSRSLRRIVRKTRPPANIVEVVTLLGMKQYLPIFVLNGYEDLTLFKDLDDEELDYLGITDERQREKLIELANLLFPDDNKGTTTDEDEDSFDNSAETEISGSE